MPVVCDSWFFLRFSGKIFGPRKSDCTGNQVALVALFPGPAVCCDRPAVEFLKNRAIAPESLKNQGVGEVMFFEPKLT